MKKNIMFITLAALIVFSMILTGCSSGGIAQSEYDKVTAQLAGVQAQLTKAQADLAAEQASAGSSQEAQTQITSLQKQVADLQSKYEFAGMTTEQKVTQIIVNYHAAHTYLANIYDCNDMSGDVWDLLKKQGITSRLVIGNIDENITDILASDHAWILAEISPGSYLALETTGGVVYTRTEKPAYFHGWYFTSPDQVVAYHDYVAAYNEGVALRNKIAAEDNRIVDLVNSTQSETWMAVHNELTSLITMIETDISAIHSKIDALATVLN
jgi:hypothetical protein